MEYTLISRKGIKTFGDGVIDANKNVASFQNIAKNKFFDTAERKVVEDAVVEFAKQATALIEIIDTSHEDYGRINFNLVVTYIALKLGFSHVNVDILNLNKA